MSERIVDDPSQHGWVDLGNGKWGWGGSGGGGGGGVVGPISLNDLEDVLAESPEKDNLIIFDGSEWVSSFPPLIESEITYQGGYNFSLDAPADPQDGDLYINDTDGTVHASWGAIAGTPVLAGNVVAYAEAKGRWFLLGDLSSTAVTSISQGAGVSVDSSKPREPVVGVNFGTAAGQVAQGNHNHSGVYEPVINPKNSAFNKNFGTAAGQVAEGNHNHDGVYQPTGNYLTSIASGNGTKVTGNKVEMSGSYTGNFSATGNITAFSDERLKSDIETLDGSKVYEMRGVLFTKDGEQGSGVIAQEIQKIAPELVHEGDDYLSVAYGNLVGYLIEAVKDLKAEIEELKK